MKRFSCTSCQIRCSEVPVNINKSCFVYTEQQSFGKECRAIKFNIKVIRQLLRTVNQTNIKIFPYKVRISFLLLLLFDSRRTNDQSNQIYESCLIPLANVLVILIISRVMSKRKSSRLQQETREEDDGNNSDVSKSQKVTHCNYSNSDGTKCAHTSKRSDNLLRHIREKHLGYVYHCGTEDCYYWAASKNHVLQHKNSGHVLCHGQADVQEIQQCRGCKYYFRDKTYCHVHLETCPVYNISFFVIIFELMKKNNFRSKSSSV